MIFSVSKASDREYREEIEMTTIDELIAFIEKHNSDVIVSDGHITIYDYYVE